LLLERQGKWAEAAKLYHRALTLDPKNAWARARLPLVRRLTALQPKLPAFLKGEFRPRDNEDRLALVALSKHKRLYGTAARLYADAFAADAKLADDRKAAHRYNAACYAALAGCGKGEDAGKLDAKEKARLRAQALGWLRADLALWSKQLTSGKAADRVAVRATMRHWQHDADLAGVRDKEGLAKLPEAERAAWAKLWAQVQALLAEAAAK
jgi:serine/threonine-protein kinase